MSFFQSFSRTISAVAVCYLIVAIAVFSAMIVSCDNFSGPQPRSTTTTGGNSGNNNGGNTGGNNNGGNTGGMTVSCDTAGVTFSKNVLPVLEANCAGCHSGGAPTAGVNLSNYQGVKRVVDAGRFPNVLTGAEGAAQMPPGSRLNACDIAKIQAWARKGAAND